MPIMTIEDIRMEKNTMDKFAAELDNLMAELGYDEEEHLREMDRMVGVVLLG